MHLDTPHQFTNTVGNILHTHNYKINKSNPSTIELDSSSCSQYTMHHLCVLLKPSHHKNVSHIFCYTTTCISYNNRITIAMLIEQHINTLISGTNSCDLFLSRRSKCLTTKAQHLISLLINLYNIVNSLLYYEKILKQLLNFV